MTQPDQTRDREPPIPLAVEPNCFERTALYLAIANGLLDVDELHLNPTQTESSYGHHETSQ